MNLYSISFSVSEKTNIPWQWWWNDYVDVDSYLEEMLGTLSILKILETVRKEYGRKQFFFRFNFVLFISLIIR